MNCYVKSNAKKCFNGLLCNDPFGMHINYTSVGLDINTYLRVCILT